MKRPAKLSLGRLNRGRKTSFWNKLTGKREHRLPANVTSEGDWEVEVPQIRMSRAFAVMLVLHVVAVGGLFAFRIWGKDDGNKTSAGTADNTTTPSTITAPEPVAAPNVANPPAETIPAPSAEPVKTYTWHTGDSLPLVAARFGVTSSALRDANPDVALVPGAELMLPRAGRVIGGPEVSRTEGQGTAIFDPLAKTGTPAEPRPPKAEVVPELETGPGIPDVIPAPGSELAGTTARTVATVTPTSRPKADPAKTKTDTAAPKAKPVTTAATPETPARVAGQRVHVVSKGDTVYSMARKYGFSAEEIAKANSLDAGYHIKLGQQIRIPVKR